MTIRKPGIEIEQIFTATTSESTNPLYPIIIGPIYNNLNYPDKKDDIELGEYDYTQDTIYDYPGQIGDVVTDDVKVYMEGAELEYFNKAIGSGVYEFRIVDGYKNKIRTAGDTLIDQLIFRDYTDVNDTEYSRSIEFYDRDVAVGDSIVIVDTYGNEVKTTIRSLEQDIAEASIGLVTNMSTNHPAQSHYIGVAVPVSVSGDDIVTTSGTYVGDMENDLLEDIYTVEVAETGEIPAIAVTPNAGVIDTLTTNDIFDNAIAETYKVEVTKGGAPLTAEITITELIGGNVFGPTVFAAFDALFDCGDKSLQIQIADTSTGGLLTLGDFWEVACTPSAGRFSITTQSGADNVTSRVFPGFGIAFSCGTLGALISFRDGGDGEISAGDTWTITTKKRIDTTVPTSGGTYIGNQNIHIL